MAGQANIEINVQSTTLGQLETKLESLNAQIKEVGVNSAEFKKLSKEIRQTQGQVDKASASLQKLDVGEVAGNVGKLAAGVGAAGIAISTFAGENEELEKTLQKTNAILALGAAAEGVAAAATLASTVATKASAVAQGAYAAVVGSSTGALKLFRLALVSTGIGAIVVGIGLLVANWDNLTKSVKGSNSTLENIGDTILTLLGPLGIVIRTADAFAESIGGWDQVFDGAIGAFTAFFTRFSDIASSIGDAFTAIFELDFDALKAAIAQGFSILKEEAVKAVKESREAEAKENEIADLQSIEKENERNVKRLEALQSGESAIFNAKRKALQDRLRLEELQNGKETDAYKDLQVDLLALTTEYNAKQKDLRDKANKEREEEIDRLGERLSQGLDFEAEEVFEEFLPGPQFIADELDKTLEVIEAKLLEGERLFLESGDSSEEAVRKSTQARLGLELEAANRTTEALAKQIEFAKEGTLEKLELETEYQQILLRTVEIQDELALQNFTTQQSIENFAEVTARINEGLQIAGGLANGLIGAELDAIGVRYDNLTENIEANYADQIAAAEGNAEKIASLEAQKEQKLIGLEQKRAREEEKLAIKAANVKFALDVGNIVSSTASAIAASFAAAGGFPAGIGTAAIMAGIGAVQLATAAKARSTAVSAAKGGGGGSGGGGGGGNSGRTQFADGGLVEGPGTGTSDSINARLSNGEFVINAASTERFLPLLEQINSGPQRFATGGMASRDAEMNAVLRKIDQRLATPPKAYVVSSEIREGLDTDAFLKRRASITN